MAVFAEVGISWTFFFLEETRSRMAALRGVLVPLPGVMQFYI